MRTLMAVVGLVVGMSVYAALPAAEKKADQQGAAGLVARIQDLNLTDEQEAKIADTRTEFRPKIREAAKEKAAVVKDEVEKVRAVLTPEQKSKLQAMKEERRERRERRAEGLAEQLAHLEGVDLTDAERAQIAQIRREYHPRVVNALAGLKGTLTAEQRKAREEVLQAGKKRREALASLNLTAEQKEKVEAVGKEVRTLVREELEKIRDVLTEGQEEKLQELKEERRERVRDRRAHRIANLEGLNLTDEQKSQIAEIRKEYRPRVQEAGNKLRAAIREELGMIVAVLKG